MTKTKKLAIAILSTLVSFGATSHAYSPTSWDVIQVNNLKSQLNTIISWNNYDNWSFYYQVKQLQKQYSFDQKINYMLSELETHLFNKFSLEKTKAKVESKQFKQDFISLYNTWIQEISGNENCTWRYNTIDNISFANNFPTALTLATWYRETNCGYYLPSNNNWPFQIISKSYGTWAITEEIFIQSIQDFIDFSKTKYGNYKSKIGEIFNYTWFDLTGIVNHAALYNWGLISWSIVNPNNPKYVFDWYGNYTWALRHWILPKFIKLLKREIENTY